MARFPGAERIYDVAAQFRRRCLAGGRSLLWPDIPAWTPENIDALYAALVDGAIHGNDQSFAEKFRQQLAPLGDDVARVAADVVAFYYLFASDVRPATKIGGVREVLAWKLSGEEDPPAWPEVEAAFAHGIGSVGLFYKANKPDSIAYLLAVAGQARRDPRAVEDDDALVGLADDVQARVPNSIAARNVLLHLLLPDRFERIASSGHKRRIVAAFSGHAAGIEDVDEALRAVRAGLIEAGSPDAFDFYDDPAIHRRWSADTEPVRKLVGRIYPDPDVRRICLAFLAESIGRAHAVSATNWCVSVRQDQKNVRLNVGRAQACTLGRGGDIWLAIHRDALAEDPVLKAVVEREMADGWNIGAGYSRMPDAYGVAIPGDRAEELLPLVRDAHHRYLAGAAKVRLTGDWARSHNPAVIEFLRQELDIDVPDRQQDAAAGDDEDEPRRFWLFQANPAIYDLAAEAAKREPGDTDSWLVTRFGDGMRPGDGVVLWQGGPAAGIYALAELAGVPFERPTSDIWPDREQRGETEWAVGFRYERILSPPLPKARLRDHPVLSALPVLKMAQGTNYQLPAEQWDAIHEAIAQPDPLADLVARTHMDEAELRELRDLLLDRKQLILEGPPGTGKTYLADLLARWVAGEPLAGNAGDRVEIVQFHQSYGYEDFVQGIRPTSEGGGLSYRVVPGIFLRMCERARRSPEHPHVLVIDEINRGNLSRIFGELLMALEYRERPVRLPYGTGDDGASDVLRIPANLLVVGTMNSTDRSLALMDYALRRRFYFHRLSAVRAGAAPVLDRWLAARAVAAPGRARLLALFLALNARIEERLSPDFQVGHSYFMRDDIATEAGLDRVWRHAVLPLLAEYFHGARDPEAVLAEFALDRLHAATASEPVVEFMAES